MGIEYRSQISCHCNGNHLKTSLSLSFSQFSVTIHPMKLPPVYMKFSLEGAESDKI